MYTWILFFLIYFIQKRYGFIERGKSGQQPTLKGSISF